MLQCKPRYISKRIWEDCFLYDRLYQKSVNVVEFPLPWWGKTAEKVEQEESNLEASGKKLDNIPKATTASASLSYGGVADEAPNKAVFLMF